MCLKFTNIVRHIEGVLSILADAGLMMGLESVVESWVSVMEHHSSELRPLSQERLQAESMIALNGPSVFNCDAVVGEALKSYWSKAKRAGDRDGHFVRRSNYVKCYTVSKAIDSLTSMKPKVLFMTEPLL